MSHSSASSAGRVVPLLAFLLLLSQSAISGELKFALANSTCDAMRKVGELFQKSHDVTITYTCKSSGLLAKGLVGKALDADIFISANQEWMDYLVEKNLVAKSVITTPCRSSLVVAVPRNSALRLNAWEDLGSEKVTSIIIGDPGLAPFGRYAKQALEHTGLWERVKHKITTRKNIELLADSLAQANASTVGIMFKANLNEQLNGIYVVKPSWHQPVQYFMAPLKASANDRDVKNFLRFMETGAAKALIAAEGFEVD